jgi:uncharacterized protein with ParB-like and HNH nuclease domain
MNERKLDILSISQILDFNFYVPAYQRGYRWTEHQVENLLNDISDFKPDRIDSTDEQTWYCLQPLVVKLKSIDENKKKWFEVIDGQQRLTTIYLILHYLNQGYVASRRKKIFELDYATRKTSKTFLIEKLNENSIDKSNIDYFHISSAYSIIHKWFTKIGSSFKYAEFETKFIENTKVIWYETEEKDTISIFTRINIGKIPLTNSELVKALFLNSSNFDKKKSEKSNLKQIEISTEWDRIENILQNRDFWYFINEKENELETRFEFILNLLANKTDKDHEFFTFEFFYKKFNNCGENKEIVVSDNWKEIKKVFQTIEEWFLDREFYHKIGFLITVGEKINDLIKLSRKILKSEFKIELNKKIGKKIECNLRNLKYSDKQKVRNILLLHNIQTILNNQNETSRFMFDMYKKEKWDIEHIHAIAEEMPEKEEHQIDWLKEVSEFISDETLKKKATELHLKDFANLYKTILDYFSENNKHEDVDDISNLVLLDASTNRAYKNSIFPVKRKTIIEKDRQGVFIPICTRNVFMKYYNFNVSQMTFWGEIDEQKYINDIFEVLTPYKTIKMEEQTNE